MKTAHRIWAIRDVYGVAKSPFVLLIFLLNTLCFNDVLCLSVGSNTVPSRQNSVTFLRIDSDNTMLGFAAFENGFVLQSSTTTCTFDDFFPVSGTVNFRGGRLHLKKDLLFDKGLNITNSGSIFATNYSIEFGKLITDLRLSTSLTFDSATLVFNADAKIRAPLICRNSCKINGRGKRLTFENAGTITVWPGGNLIIEDTELWQLNKNDLRCLTDRGSITFKNCVLSLSQDFTYSQGSLLFQNDVVITGTNKFIYTTGLTSTIDSGAVLMFDCCTTFSYAPRLPKTNLLYMTDATSNLYLNGCTLYSTKTGLVLSTGTLTVDDRVTLTSDAVYYANALRLSSNLAVNIRGMATLGMYGTIRYD